MRKSTEELTNEIKSGTRIDSFLRVNRESFEDLSLAGYLQERLEAYGCSRREVLERADMTSTNYGYEMFHSDKKVAGRDKIIQICMGFPLNLEETQKALRCGNAGPLYPRRHRDAIIMMAIHRGYTVGQLNDLLYENQEKTLF